MRSHSVMYAPEVIDLLDGEFDRLLPLIRNEGFPMPRRIPGEDGGVGWYRHQIEQWFADRMIKELQGSADGGPTSEEFPQYVDRWAARFPGTCAKCGERFGAGTPIGKIDDRYFDSECLKFFERGAYYNMLGDDEEDSAIRSASI